MTEPIASIYLETTMFSFYHETRTAPPYLELRAEVRRIFELIKEGVFVPYSSPYATREIAEEENADKRIKMQDLLAEYRVKLLDETDEVTRLAQLYLQEKAISPQWPLDAAHIAITAVNGLDFIASLNFTHIARPWTIEKVRKVNAREGYKGIGIYKPSEVLEIYEGLHD
jgi:hypothetical protein